MLTTLISTSRETNGFLWYKEPQETNGFLWYERATGDQRFPTVQKIVQTLVFHRTYAMFLQLATTTRRWRGSCVSPISDKSHRLNQRGCD